MADTSRRTDGPTTTDFAAWQLPSLPDWDNDFVGEEDIVEFAKALAAPENSPSQEDLTSPDYKPTNGLFITALNDWRPVRQRVRRKKNPHTRGKDEIREGYLYGLLKWPLLIGIFGWIVFLGVSYLLTRLYIWLYEQFVTWRGKRERLRAAVRNSESYEDWIKNAKELDTFLGNDKWREEDDYAYYDSKTIRRVRSHMRRYRQQAEADEYLPVSKFDGPSPGQTRPIDELKGLVEACIKNNFVGFENPRLYSETYYGTKDLVQSFVDEVQASLTLLNKTRQLDAEIKRALFKHLHRNYGRSALCLSGGATFAYYHFGVAKALLDANLLPSVITGTSGGALVAALLCTRTNEELKQLLIPALAYRITACHDAMHVWLRRWWKTGARFDSIDWAARCSWFTRGSMTFREAYLRTGRILNVSCVPSDPHSPTILANYLTSPDCVIWSAVLASAAVPGILNPVVLMKKGPDGKLSPYSFGHKWKDGSLRTDIPIKALNLHFNVNFSIVSQVNPHINLFFFSSRGTIGRPVTHRKGRGWRGGFLGSAAEQYLKLDLTKWLKVLRHLELLPRPLGQDWSEIWLQRFSGTITIWPKSIPSDFYYILSDPTPARLARMLRQGQLSTWPKLKFIGNRMTIERLITEGRRTSREALTAATADMSNVLSEENLQELLRQAQANNGFAAPRPPRYADETDDETSVGPGAYEAAATAGVPGALGPAPPQSLNAAAQAAAPESPTLSNRLSGWWNRSRATVDRDRPSSMYEMRPRDARRFYEQLERTHAAHRRRKRSLVDELGNQSRVFFDDDDFDRDASELSDDVNGSAGEPLGDDDGPSEVGTYMDDEEDDDVDDGDKGLRLRRSTDRRERESEELATQKEERPSVVG